MNTPRPLSPIPCLELLSSTEAAALLGLPLRTFQYECQAGRLPAPVSGRRPFLWARRDVEAVHVAHLDLVTAPEAAALLGVPVRTFQRWVARGRLPGPVDQRRPWRWSWRAVRARCPSAPGTAAEGPRWEPTRLASRWPAITLTRYARTHVLACRDAAGLLLWCERDLTLRVKPSAGADDPEPGKVPHSATCLPLGLS